MNIKEIQEKMVTDLCGKKLINIVLSAYPSSEDDDIILFFEDGHMLKISVPLGHSFGDLNMEISDGETGWRDFQ